MAIVKKVIVVTTHLRRDRSKRRTKDILQPINGLHIGSLIDQSKYHVTLYNEDLHGPYDTSKAKHFDLVFLSGLQADFDRMRQLSYHFRCQGAVVIAGGSICTLFPEFASRFFNVVCAGGVENVLDFMEDYEKDEYKPIYHSPQRNIRPYRLDYSLLPKNGIHPPVHLIEASRGCNYQCKFCVLPAEGARHTPYELEGLFESIENSIKTSPPLSLRRNYPIIWFVDNNFTNNINHLTKLCDLLHKDHSIKAWGALVTQNVLEDRSLIRYMRKCKCRVVFTGLESLDNAFHEAQNKQQNISAGNVLADIRYAERHGVAVLYAYIFDPRLTSVAGMNGELDRLIAMSTIPMATFFSFLSPLLGTQLFWESYAQGELLPDLRLRDLDGETVAFGKLADQIDVVADFARMLSSGLHHRISSGRLLRSTFRRIVDSRTLNPFFWHVFHSTNFRAVNLARDYQRGNERTYIAGSDILDPQYDEYPPSISEADLETYFSPIHVLDVNGRLADWLEPYVPESNPQYIM